MITRKKISLTKMLLKAQPKAEGWMTIWSIAVDAILTSKR